MTFKKQTVTSLPSVAVSSLGGANRLVSPISLSTLSLLAAASSPSSPSTTSTTTSSQTNMRIAIVDDNPINQHILKKALSRHLNYYVSKDDIFNNGLELLQALSVHTYNLVLMDIDMPVMNGCEAVQYIRRSTISTTVPSTTTIYPTTPSPTPPPQRIRQENTTIPVIAVTTNCLDADKRLYTSLGMNCVVSKTDVVKNPNELVRCISQHLPELLQSVVAA